MYGVIFIIFNVNYCAVHVIALDADREGLTVDAFIYIA